MSSAPNLGGRLSLFCMSLKILRRGFGVCVLERIRGLDLEFRGLQCFVDHGSHEVLACLP